MPEELPKAVWINPPQRVKEDKRAAPKANCPGAALDTPLTHPRSGYPSAGCVPAEPASVSPDGCKLPDQKPLNTRVMPVKIPSAQALTNVMGAARS